jgi:phospholipid transport system substrate-binding protein
MFKQAFLVLLLAFTGVSTSLASDTKGPYEVVADTTQELLKVIEEARSYIDEDEPRFTGEILRIMDEVVDFQSFARGVMGDYGSSQAYRRLSTDEERAAFRDRVFRFTETFREGLINTYSKGLLAFDGNRIEVLPELLVTDASGELKKVSADEISDKDLQGSVSVRQEIYGERAKPYEVIYTLRKDRDGQWKLRNVVIEGLNLGQIYKSQFVAAVETENGDIDKVIANWTVAPKEVMEKQASAQ